MKSGQSPAENEQDNAQGDKCEDDIEKKLDSVEMKAMIQEGKIFCLPDGEDVPAEETGEDKKDGKKNQGDFSLPGRLA